MTLTRTYLLLASAAMIATPALAQETTPPVSAPPAQETPAPAPAPAPVQQTPTPAPAPTGGSPTTVRPEALEVRDEAREEAAAERRAARPAAARARSEARTPARQTARAAAPVSAAEPAPAPPASTPTAESAAPATPAPEAAAAAAAAPAAEPAASPAPAQEESGGTPIWPLLAILGLGVLAVLGFLALRRRRAAEQEEMYEEPYTEQPVAAEPAYVEPEPELRSQPVVAPVAAPIPAPRPEPEVVARREHVVAAGSFGITAPVIRPKRPPMPPRVAPDPTPPVRETLHPVEPVAAAEPTPPLIEEAPSATAEDVSVAQAEAEDVASLTAAAPVTDRPWLEFAMRPVRAGTSDDEALVEIELTVANAGTLPAEDVRISTFMLPAGSAGDVERMLTDAPTDNAVQSATIDPGEGTRIDATLALRKSDIGGAGEGFTPVVVADARYRLPDGSVGRTAASFIVGRSNGTGGLVPFVLEGSGMHEEIEAQLYGEPERA